MYLLLLIIAIIVCALLVLIVLIQNPKGGGLSSNFSSSSQLMGVQKTGDFLEKGTWVLAITLMVLSMAINVSVKGGVDKTTNSQYKDQVDKASKPTGNTAAPAFPAPQQPAAAQPTAPAAKPAK
jgi:preprotein translocase subunit SecG